MYVIYPSNILNHNFVGTGAISSLFSVFPYATRSRPMMTLSLLIFFVNLVMFTVFTIMAACKYICYPKTWASMFQNPVNSLYVGCFPMAATTLLNVSIDVLHGYFGFGGRPFLYTIWSLWWIVVVISFLCCWICVHIMVSRQSHHLETMTAMWLLPVVTVIVSASSGGIIAPALQPHAPQYAFITTVLSAFMISMGLTLALMILTIYFMRLVVYGLPAGPAILSVFLPLGPTAQSGYAIYLIGESFHSLIPLSNPGSSTFMSSEFTARVIETVCTCIAFVLWSLATMWACYAFLAISSRLKQSSIPFRPSFWGLVFPNCVYANLTIRLAGTFNSTFFRVFGSIYACAALILWVCISIRSVWEMRLLFVVPDVPVDGMCASQEAKTIRFEGTLQASARTSITQLV
ncbi:voltage-dependent anion channel [Panaeolus papilionaceus]|nr:voltage-dependent anion channel [Panaeolus papilionaceus]